MDEIDDWIKFEDNQLSSNHRNENDDVSPLIDDQFVKKAERRQHPKNAIVRSGNNDCTVKSHEEKSRSLPDSDKISETNISYSRGVSQHKAYNGKSEALASSTNNIKLSREKWVSFEKGNTFRDGLSEEHFVQDRDLTQTDHRREISNVDHQSPIHSIFSNMNSPVSVLSGIYIPDIFNIDADSYIVQPEEESKNSVIGKDRIADHQETIFAEDVEEDFDTHSIVSADICNLNIIENDSLLMDTRKKFPNEQLFQASAPVQECQIAVELDGTDEIQSSRMETNNFFNRPGTSSDFPEVDFRREWTFFYRFPEKKKKTRRRDWINVNIQLDNNTIFVSGRTKGRDVAKEIPLNPYFAFTLPILHRQRGGFSNAKLHSVKLQYVKYTEKRKISTKFNLEHQPSYTPVLKIASHSIGPLRHFIDSVENIVRRIESHRDIGVTHRHEEIFIDCDDICKYELDGHGKVKRYSIVCQIRLRVFVTGAPTLILFINDADTIQRQKLKNVDKKHKKHSKWIELDNIELHPCVDADTSKEEGGLVFKPPDGCSFEIMRFHTRSPSRLPLVFKASVDFKTTWSLEIKAECKVNSEGKMMKYQRKNIMVCFGIPSSWKTAMTKSRGLGRKKKFLHAKSDSKTLKSGIARSSTCFIEVSSGSAKYEPEYNALVWRVGDLPILANGVPADAVQTFYCHIALPFEIDLTDKSMLSADVEFEINQTLGSEIQIHEVLVSDERLPDKWVCYKSTYFYKVFLDVINKERLPNLP